jgi:hypothetical protein
LRKVLLEILAFSSLFKLIGIQFLGIFCITWRLIWLPSGQSLQHRLSIIFLLESELVKVDLFVNVLVIYHLQWFYFQLITSAYWSILYASFEPTFDSLSHQCFSFYYLLEIALHFLVLFSSLTIFYRILTIIHLTAYFLQLRSSSATS